MTPLHSPAPQRRQVKTTLVLASLAYAGLTACGQTTRVAAQFDSKAWMEPHKHPEHRIEMPTNGVEIATLFSPQQHTLHFNTNDWKVLDGALKNISGTTATAMWLEPNGEYDAATVRAGVMLVRANSLGSRSTLLASDFTVRTASRQMGGTRGIIDSFFASEGVRTWANQREGAALSSNDWLIISFILPEAVHLNGIATSSAPGADSRIMLLGDSGPVAWQRAFDGELLAVTLLSGDSGSDEEIETVLRGIEHALAIRYGIRKTIRPATAAERSAAFAAGYHSFNAWSTLLLLR